MKEIISKIAMQLKQKFIDWSEVEEAIKCLGENINMYDDGSEECILSELYMSTHRPGTCNKMLTELFVKHGFDVSANEGKNGASCLSALCWSSYDEYILHIAERLLELGADSTISTEGELDEENRGVLSSIAWKFGYWNTGEYDSANMFVAYYEMIKRHQEGKKYKGIRAFRDSVGETVTKVEKLKVYDDQNKKRVSYLLHCGEKHLVVSDYVELMVNPYVREEAIEVEDVSDEFKCFIGSKIRGLRYMNASLAKLNLDNGVALLIGHTGVGEDSDQGAWFRITTNGQTRLPREGTPIESIKLWGSIRHSEKSTFYPENTIILNTTDAAYALYSHELKYGEASVRVEQMTKDLGVSIRRSIEIHNPILEHIEHSNQAIKWISIKCEEGLLYIATDGFTNVTLFMSASELDEDTIMREAPYTNGLKKINFLDGIS